MKRKISIITILVIAIGLYTYHAMVGDSGLDKETFNILIIKSYSRESEKDKMFEKLTNYTIPNVDSVYNYKINTEYLDVSLMDNEEYIKDCIVSMKYKYSNKNIDFIFTIGEEAFDISRNVLDDEDTSLYKTPMFFIDVNRKKTLTEDEKTYITGIYTRSKTRQFLDMIYKVEDDVENINVILSESQNNYYMREFLESNMDVYEDINLKIIQSKNINDIYDELDRLNNYGKTVNIVSGEFIDYNNAVVPPDDVINGIKSYINAPIYTNDIIYLDSGITGSCIINFASEIGFIEKELKTKIEGLRVEGVEPQLAENYKKFIDIRSINKYIEHMGFVNSDIKVQLYNGTLLNLALLFKSNERFRIAVISIFLSIVLIIVLFIYNIREKQQNKNKELIKKEKEKVKIDLIATLNHEIRTPLNIILNSTKLIKNNINNVEYINQRLNNIDSNSYRLLRITNNILDITKIEAGNFTLNKELVNIVEIAEDVFQECIRFAAKKNIEIIFDTEEEEILTVLDKEMFQRAILNIISNSIKFTNKESEICGYIHIDKKNVVIDIEDSGIGIADDKLPYIVEKFSQTADILTRENEGTGLGLYLTTKIIESHKGKILITSEDHKGTLVQVILPIVNEEVDKKCTSTMLTIKELAEIEMSDLI